MAMQTCLDVGDACHANHVCAPYIHECIYMRDSGQPHCSHGTSSQAHEILHTKTHMTHNLPKRVAQQAGLCVSSPASTLHKVLHASLRCQVPDDLALHQIGLILDI